MSLKIGRFSQKVRQIIRHPRQLIWKNSVAIQDKLKSRIVAQRREQMSGPEIS